MKKTSAILAALSMGVATAVAGPTYAPSGKEAPPPPPSVDPCAGPISYNNIELLYANTDWGFGSDDGLILRAEYSPMQNLYLAAGLQYTDTNTFIRDVWDFDLGVGGYFPLTQNIHIAADVGYTRQSFDFFDDNGTTGNPLDDFWNDQSNDGWYARPHFRGKWGCLTVHAGAIYRHLDFRGLDFFEGGDWAYFAQLYYQLHTNWDITAGYLNGENDREQWTIGARYRF